MADNNAISIKIHLLYIFVIFVCVSMMLYVIYQAGRPGSIKLKLGNSQVEFSLEGDSLSVRKVLDGLLANEETKRESEALLREFGGFYHPNDPGVVDAIAKQNVESEVAVRLRSLLYGLKGPFRRSAHTFYNVEDVEMIDAIEKLGFNHSVSKGLRGLLISRKGPFEESSREVLVSVPLGDGIPVGRAASCKGGEFYRREIRIFNFQRTNSISVFVSGSFPCPGDLPDSDIFRLVQLSYVDMKRLIGDSALSGKEVGFAEVLLDAQ